MRHYVVFALAPEDPLPFSLAHLDADAPDPTPPEHARVTHGPHLTQWVIASAARVEGHYLFDDDYARAHPEALDPRHLGLLHALLNFKLFDDGDLLLAPRQLAGALRWPALDEPRRALNDR